MGNIANLAFKISANAEEFVGALDKAAAKAESWAKKITGVLTSPLTVLGKISAVPGNFLGGLAEGAKGLLTSIPFVGGAFAAIPTSAAGFVSWLKETGNEMRGISKQAQQLGIDTTTFSALYAKAGGDAEQFAHNLQHLSRELGALAAGDQGQKDKFNRLFGPGADKKFAGIGLEAAVKKIADQFAAIPDQTVRASKAAELFGRDAKTALEIFGKGAGNVDEIVAGMKQKGIAFSTADVQALVDANKATKEIEGSITGIGRQLAIAVSPLVKNVAEGFAGWLKGVDIKKVIFDAINSIVRFTATVANFFVDIFNRVSIMMAVLKDPKHIDVKLLSPVNWKPLTPPKADGKPLGPVAPDLTAVAAESDKLAESLRTQAETWGMTSAQVAIFKLQQNGATDEILKGARANAAQVQALEDWTQKAYAGANATQMFYRKLEELDELQTKGAISLDAFHAAAEKLNREFEKQSQADWVKMMQDGLDPLEAWAGKLKEIDRLMQEFGKDAEDAGDAAAIAAAKAFDQLKAQHPNAVAGSIAAPQLLDQGSAAELSARNRFERQGLGGDVQEQIRQILEAAQAQRERQIEIGQQILDAARADKNDPPLEL